MRSRDWVTVVSGGAAAATAVFVVGGAFRWTQALVALLVAVALAPQVLSRRVLGRSSPLVVVLGAAAALTAFSLLPLPEGVRELLDPVGSALRADGATLLDLSPWPGLTRDTPGSIRGLVFFLTLLGVAVIALRLAVSERGRYRLVAGVGIVCGTSALVVGIHALVGATRLYGIYDVEQAHPSVLGPLLNENHLGALMAIGACVGGGLALHPRQRSWIRVAWMGQVILCGIATAASSSRGALLALGIGALVSGGTFIAQRFTKADAHGRKRRGKFATSSVPIAIVGVCVVVVAVYSSAGKVSSEVSRHSLHEEVQQPRSKFAAWRSAKTLVAESPWVGVGRGGFEPSFTRVHPASGSVIFSHVENEYIQATVDWGIPGTLILGCAVVWFCVVALRRWRDGPLTAGTLGALVAIAVQSNVDFGIELLGLAVPVTVLAATLAYVPLREASSTKTFMFARGLRFMHVGALTGGALLLLSGATMSLDEEHDALRKPGVMIADVRAELERHPFDYYGYARGAELLARNGDARAIRLLNQAMRLHPTHPDLHRVAAGFLYRGGHVDQATVEYASAVRATAEPQRLLKEIVGMFTPQQAAMAIPTDYNNPQLIIGILKELNRGEVAGLWLARVVQSHPKDVRLCNMLYDLSLERGDLNGAEVAGRACVELMPDHQTRLSLANVLAQKQGYNEVIRLLEDIDTWQGRIDDKVAGWLTLCDAYNSLERWDDAVLCLHRLDASGSVTLEKRGVISDRLEKISEVRRNHDVGSGSGAGSAH